AHLLLVAGLVLAARARGPHARHGDGVTLHGARGYDWLVRLLTFGREGALRRWTLDLAGVGPGGAVLDVGAGTGTLLLAAAERIGPGGVLRGVELSPEMAARTRDKARKRGVELEITEASAARLPWPDATFDAVTCSLVLHHLTAAVRDDAVREMRRVLRPGGTLVLVDWAAPRSLLRVLFDGMALVYFMHRHSAAASPLDSPALARLLDDLGLQSTRHAWGSGALSAIVARIRRPHAE
ncbi:MAG: methyltransferase domain-containing protein, partial [Planctomycetia bacterium]|nr:methyltransferase domain-containing protein [Planctomycetia bacterium]